VWNEIKLINMQVSGFPEMDGLKTYLKKISMVMCTWNLSYSGGEGDKGEGSQVQG
jgi:hypothetical protein